MSSIYIGLISGTSADAIDAVAVNIDEHGNTTQIATAATPLPNHLRDKIFSIQSQPTALQEIGALDVELGEIFANAALQLITNNKINKTDINAIGSHGQTLLHQPDAEFPFTMQLGDPNIIAERTGITTVADLRRRDMAAGGQGAPLVLAFHQAWLGEQQHTVVLNMGGIANITVLANEGREPLLGFDTGPANTLLDAWTRLHLNKPFDENGTWSQQGTVHKQLLESLLKHPYFRQTPPKSADIKQFDIKWLNNFIQMFAGIPEQDVATTLVEFSVSSIASAIQKWANGTQQVVACGGGCKNKFLMHRLAKNLKPITLHTSNEFGIDADWVEATAFAWLAQQTMNKKPGNAPRSTGAKHACVLGGVYYA